MSRAARHRRPCGAGERGSGLLSTLFGVAVMLAMLMLATNVTLGLWQRTTVDAVAYDVARRVATAPQGTDRRLREADAIREGRSRLGGLGDEVDMHFVHDPVRPDIVVLAVSAPGVDLVPAAGFGPVVADLDRRIVVTVEDPP